MTGMRRTLHNFHETPEKSRQRWEACADYWDARMGDTSNLFHCNIVRPHTEELLDIRDGDLVLDIACGTGNFSEWLAAFGADVVAFDYSGKMISHARKRRLAFPDKVSFHVCDATNRAQITTLIRERPFDKSVANMAVMDIADIEPLFGAVWEMLRPGGSLSSQRIIPVLQNHPIYTGIHA